MNYQTDIRIPQESINKWNDAIRSDADFNSYGYRPNDTVAHWTAKFSNGFEVDLNVNTDEDGKMYAEMILLNQYGQGVDFSEPQYEIDGAEWYLYHDEDTYRVDVFAE